MLKRLLINPKMRGFAVVLEETSMPFGGSGTILGIYLTEEEAKEAARLAAAADPTIITDEEEFNKANLRNARLAFGIEP